MSFPVAEAIKASGSYRFIFASGYDAAMAPNQYCGLLVLQKPYSLNKLKSAIDLAMRTHRHPN
jgi:hypothetical protein